MPEHKYIYIFFLTLCDKIYSLAIEHPMDSVVFQLKNTRPPDLSVHKSSCPTLNLLSSGPVVQCNVQALKILIVHEPQNLLTGKQLDESGPWLHVFELAKDTMTVQ